MPKPCTRCLLKDLSPEEYQKVIEKGLNDLPEEVLTDTKTREKRLEECRNCGKLNRGTCLACGCYVEIRAALIKGKCPYKKW